MMHCIGVGGDRVECNMFGTVMNEDEMDLFWRIAEFMHGARAIYTIHEGKGNDLFYARYSAAARGEANK